MAYQKDFQEYNYKLRLGLSLLVIGHANTTTHCHAHHAVVHHHIFGCYAHCFNSFFDLGLNKKTSAVVQRFDGCILKFKIMP